MGNATRSSVNCRSMEVSNLLEFIKSRVADFRILSNSGIMLRPQGWEVAPMEILVLVPASSITVTGSWGGRFTNYTVNWSINWYGPINASPADLTQSLSRRSVCKDFPSIRNQQQLWRHSNFGVCRRRRDRDFSDGPFIQYILVKFMLLVRVTVSGPLLV